MCMNLRNIPQKNNGVPFNAPAFDNTRKIASWYAVQVSDTTMFHKALQPVTKNQFKMPI
jgi:hypothetical protein